MASLDLRAIMESRLVAGTKGLPLSGEGLTLGEIGAQGWSVLDGSVPLPVCVAKASALTSNINCFQEYVQQAGAQLAPHGKTSMCPQLFDRQLQAGAWGITVATYAQARLALSIGVKNVLIANELVGSAEIQALAKLHDSDSSITVLSLVDSVDGAERLAGYLADGAASRSFSVLVELGLDGGRTGTRDHDEALKVARRISVLPNLQLRGIEGYEGLILSDDPAADARRINAFIDALLALHRQCTRESLFAPGTPIISAGGSAYFDLVASGLQRAVRPVIPLLRSGCYLTHDCGFYQRRLQHATQRALLGPPPLLRPALEIWTQVVSRPERELLIVGAGRRDIGEDAGLPRATHRVPRLGSKRPIGHKTQQPTAIDGWVTFRMNDQHTYLRIPEDAQAAAGDYVVLSISHPCTTFDKWPLIYEVDDDYRITAGLRTLF